jgi:hypothetical protein
MLPNECSIPREDGDTVDVAWTQRLHVTTTTALCIHNHGIERVWCAVLQVKLGRERSGCFVWPWFAEGKRRGKEAEKRVVAHYVHRRQAECGLGGVESGRSELHFEYPSMGDVAGRIFRSM